MKNRQVLILVFVILLTSIKGFCQNKNFVYYFDKDFNPTKKSGAIFMGSGVMENGYLHLRIYDPSNDKTVILAKYKDSSLKVGEGIYQEFFSNGKMAAEGNYNNGIETGAWRKWDDRGRLLDSTNYDQGKKLNANTFGYYKDGSLRYHYINDIIHDKESRIGYDDSGKVNFEGNFIGQHGILKYYNKQGISIDTVNSKEEIEASYPGGEQAWSNYIGKKIMENYDKLLKDGTVGTCVVRFVIDTHGKVIDIEPKTMKETLLAELAVDILKRSPKWNPARQYGRFVRAYREQPISFTITEK